MVHSRRRLAIPSNSEYSVPQVRMLVREVETILGREINLDERDPERMRRFVQEAKAAATKALEIDDPQILVVAPAEGRSPARPPARRPAVRRYTAAHWGWSHDAGITRMMHPLHCRRLGKTIAFQR